jgi:alkylhydroperoxidase/carboxymuconolactone decarboxylase family protein YurZ
MITMAVLIALSRGPELRVHMRGALNLGITQAEIKEIIIHLSQYSGVPTAVEGHPRLRRSDRAEKIAVRLFSGSELV